MREIIFVSLLLAALITGCSTSSFVRQDLRDQVGVKNPVYQEGAIERAFKKSVNLPKPFSVAVYFKTTAAGDEWRWTLEDKRKIISQLRAGVTEEYVSKIFLINGDVEKENEALPSAVPRAGDQELANIRLAAAQYQADAVLVIDGIAKVSKSPNRWSPTYVLLAPALFVNGNTADSFFAINASLWDVRNEVLYMTLNGEGSITKKYPAVWGESDHYYYEKSKQIAMEDLEKSIKDDFHPFK